MTSTPARAAKGKEIAQTSGNNLDKLADVSVRVEAVATYASKSRKLLQKLNKAILNYTSRQEELARELETATAGLF